MLKPKLLITMLFSAQLQDQPQYLNCGSVFNVFLHLVLLSIYLILFTQKLLLRYFIISRKTPTTFKNGYYQHLRTHFIPQFQNKKTETQQLSNLTKVTQPLRMRAQNEHKPFDSCTYVLSSASLGHFCVSLEVHGSRCLRLLPPQTIPESVQSQQPKSHMNANAFLSKKTKFMCFLTYKMELKSVPRCNFASSASVRWSRFCFYH